MITISENCANQENATKNNSPYDKIHAKCEYKHYLLAQNPSFHENYRKTDTAICLPVNLIFQTQKLGRFLPWSFETISIHKVSYLKLNYSCIFQLIMLSSTSDEQSNICQIWVKNNWLNTCSLTSHLLLVPKQISWLNPITYGGGEGGPFGLDHQIIDHNSKMALSSTSKLGDF